MAYTEANYENAVVQLIEQLGYTHVYGPDVVRDYTDPLYSEVLEGALIAVNPGIPQAAINEALFKLRNIENGKLEQRWVTTGKSLWGSYTEILEGLSAEDWIAFPYGKNVKPGVAAQEGDLSNLYG